MENPAGKLDPVEMSKLIQELRQIVSRYFSVEDVRWSEKAIAFYILADEDRLDDGFEGLRKELKNRGFVPALVKEQYDYIIYVTKKPPLETRSVSVNILMFILTLISTIWAGAVLWVPRSNFDMATSDYGSQLRGIFATLGDPELVAYGALFFALPLMLILGIHELGHYYMSRRHGVDASLPFFIPIPPFIGPLGTFGAFISMREPMPSKKALIDIGAAGPIAGFLVAIPVTIIGLALTGWYPIKPEPSGDFITYLGSPLIFEGFKAILPIPADASIHPTAFAGWVGILVTSMNLLPAGQLDGGHITRALFGNNAKYVSYAVVLVLIVLGFSFAGWWIFTFLILLLGTSHPPPLNDVTQLSFNRKLIGMFSVTLLVICFVPVPIMIEEYVQPEFEVDVIDNDMVAGAGETVNFTLLVENTGKEKETYNIRTEILSIQNESGMDVNEIDTGNSSGWLIQTESDELVLPKRSQVQLIIQVTVPVDADLGDVLTFNVLIQSDTDSDINDEIELTVEVGELSLRFSEKEHKIHANNITRFEVDVKNTGTADMTINLNATINSSLSKKSSEWLEPVLSTSNLVLAPNSTGKVVMEVSAPKTVLIGDYIVITLQATNLADTEISDTANFRVIVD